MRLIDADALKEHYNVPDAEGVFSYCDTIMKVIDSQPTIESDIDRAAILRLCNEIEDIVSEISKLSENYLIYSDCKSILDRTKAIGKELTGDAGSKTD